jgi:hypothetical protein
MQRTYGLGEVLLKPKKMQYWRSELLPKKGGWQGSYCSVSGAVSLQKTGVFPDVSFIICVFSQGWRFVRGGTGDCGAKQQKMKYWKSDGKK